MSAPDKARLGYGDQMNKGVLSYEKEVFQSVFVSRTRDIEDSPMNDRYAEGMHAQSEPSESDARSSDFNFCESNPSEESHESMPEPVVNEPKVSPKLDKKDCSGLMSEKLGLGSGFTKMAYFVCGSFSHLIRDCDFHEKRMAKQAELNNRMCKGSGQRENRPVWNNMQRVNHQNEFVPKAVLTRTGKIQVNTAKTSGTNTVNTARHNFNRQVVPTNATRKVNTVKPIVNNARPKAGFHITFSPFRKPFNNTTALRTNFSYQKVNTAKVNAVSVVGGKKETAVKPSAGKQHKTSCKAKTVSSISQPLQLLHMDLFGPTSVRSLNHKTYCLVITDDFSRIKREYSNAITPQQNRVDKRKNVTLIEAARTMLTDSFLPNTFWAEAVSTACYVLDRPVRSENQANKTAGPEETNHSAEILCTASDGDSLSYLLNSKRSEAKNGDVKPNRDTGPKTNEDPKDQEDQAFLEELERLKRQEKEANDAAEVFSANSTNIINTASTPISTASPSNVFSAGWTDL
ncbi:ribonuclease H-like domain-containing protein [Tanacetum coccineum]